MTRTCDNCGESFSTLTRLRLHDCPEENTLVEDAFLPEPDPDALPDRVLNEEEVSELEDHSRISRVENMMSFPLPEQFEFISFVVRVDDRSYGLHCDHDTYQWDVIVEGETHQQVVEAHQEWLADDIEEVTGGAPDADQIGELDVPETITTDCNMCGGTHELTGEVDSFSTPRGFIEYEGFCDETGHPINSMKQINEFLG